MNLQVVSQAPAVGTLQVIASLADVQGQDFAEPVILIAEEVGGMEDIPNNVQVRQRGSGRSALVAATANQSAVIGRQCCCHVLSAYSHYLKVDKSIYTYDGASI